MKKIALALVLLFGLSGCSWLGVGDLFSSSNANPVDEVKKAEIGGFPFEQMSPDAPPPVKTEFKGSPPGNIPDEYVWRNGHWDYKDGAGFSWVAGYWLRKPAFSAAWKQDMWLQRTYGWSYIPGHWE
jgi:WXXGXW repeat (2 copies)